VLWAYRFPMSPRTSTGVFAGASVAVTYSQTSSANQKKRQCSEQDSNQWLVQVIHSWRSKGFSLVWTRLHWRKFEHFTPLVETIRPFPTIPPPPTSRDYYPSIPHTSSLHSKHRTKISHPKPKSEAGEIPPLTSKTSFRGEEIPP